MFEPEGLFEPNFSVGALTDSAAQARRVLGGQTFEIVVMRILNKFLERDGITVITGKKKLLLALMENEQNAREIVAYTRLPVKRRCTQTQLEDYPDSDLFALVRPNHPRNPWRLLAIINCKVDYHARETEAAFWGLSVRTSSYIKYVCVTEDADIYGKRPRSELGRSCDQSTKIRRMLESYTDRVYLCKRYTGVGDERLAEDIDAMLHQMDRRKVEGGPFFDDPSFPRHTSYCHLVRPIDDLIDDLKRWREEIPSAE